MITVNLKQKTIYLESTISDNTKRNVTVKEFLEKLQGISDPDLAFFKIIPYPERDITNYKGVKSFLNKSKENG